MELVRPYTGPLFNSYRGLTQTPEMSPGMVNHQAQLAVDFCLSMMKLNNLKQYSVTHLLPLNDGQRGHLHIHVVMGHNNIPMVRARLDVSRKRVEEEEEEIKEGLFIINNRWLLEPDPKVKPSGKLVGQVGDWRLFDTQGEEGEGSSVFAPGQQYNGFATTGGAAWVYEDEDGKKWIATDKAKPYLKAVAGNGALRPVPPEAQAATIGCWFWYAGDKLMGSYTSGDLEVRLLDLKPGEDGDEDTWELTTLIPEDGDDNNRFFETWAPGFNQADMSADGTRLLLRGDRNNVPDVRTTRGAGSLYDINLVSKTCDLILSPSWPNESINSLAGLYKRGDEIPLTYSYQSNYTGNYTTYCLKDAGAAAAFRAEYTVMFPTLSEITSTLVYYADRCAPPSTYIYTYNSGNLPEFSQFFYYNRTYNKDNWIELHHGYQTKGGKSFRNSTFWDMNRDQTENYNSVWSFDLFLWTQDENHSTLQAGPEFDEVRWSWEYDYNCETNEEYNPHGAYEASFTKDEATWTKSSTLYVGETSVSTTSEGFNARVVSTVTSDAAGLFLLAELVDLAGGGYDWGALKLFGVANNTPVDLTELMNGDEELKTYLLEEVGYNYMTLDYGELPIPIPATRGRAFSAPE